MLNARLQPAIRALLDDGVIAYPTEAVWGLGCDPFSELAVGRILELKQRHAEQGLILIVSDLAQIQPFALPLTKKQHKKVMATWPGPVTWVLPALPGIPAWLTGGRDTIAVRWTAHTLASALCEAWGGALVSTSANRHGVRPARTQLQARSAFGKRVDCYVGGATGRAAKPSRIMDLRTGKQIR